MDYLRSSLSSTAEMTSSHARLVRRLRLERTACQTSKRSHLSSGWRQKEMNGVVMSRVSPRAAVKVIDMPELVLCKPARVGGLAMPIRALDRG